MIRNVENSITTINGKAFDVVEIKFESGKALKVLFDEKENLVKEG